jgi:hypothetical protein
MQENNDVIIDQEQSGSSRMKNSVAVLVLGIISIVTCFCYGVVGLIIGIVALSISKSEWAMYKANPGQFHKGDVSNMKAGRVCGTIGVCLGGLYLLFLLIYFIAVGSMYGLALSEGYY